jgi:two-component sensor histidine kinase
MSVETHALVVRIGESRRIEALANVHWLVVQSRWTGAELGSLVKQELSPHPEPERPAR